MNQDDIRERPVWLLLSSHWVSLLGIGLLITALVSWLIVLPQRVRGDGENPYLGILSFMIIPALFFAGLALIPVGLHLARKRIKAGIAATPAEERRALGMRLAKFFAITTAANILIGSQLTYRAVQHMETVQFCGQTCHSMESHHIAYVDSPHSQVACVECHVAPGLQGWVASKVSGSRQLYETIFNSWPRPVQSAIDTGRMVPSNQTCEHCHATQQPLGVAMRVIPKYLHDEKNTETYSVLMMLVGGGNLGGIHGKHFGPDIEISYFTPNPDRAEIPWVEFRNTRTGETREYTDGSAKPASKRLMECVDCHNRPAHTFDSAEQAVDRAIAHGQVPVGLPFVKKKGVELLTAGYSTAAEAESKIAEGITAFYRENHPDVVAKDPRGVEAAARGLQRAFSRNVFPDVKIDWGTYRNNLGHMESPGCFRCHGSALKTADGKMITDDCSVCHEMLATDEPNPEILTKLGLDYRLTDLKGRLAQQK